jgi:hypothetical protein
MRSKTTQLIAVAAVVAAFGTASVALAQDGSSAPSAAKNDSGATPIDTSQARPLIQGLDGEHVKLSDNQAARLPFGESEYAVDAAAAVAIPAPTGASGKEPWYVVPGRDSVCLVNDSITCNHLAELRRTGVMWYLMPAKDAEPLPPDTDPHLRGWIVEGLTIDDTAVFEVTGEGRGVTGKVKPENNAFHLYLPRGGDTITTRQADGKTIDSSYVGRRSTQD